MKSISSFYKRSKTKDSKSMKGLDEETKSEKINREPSFLGQMGRALKKQ